MRIDSKKEDYGVPIRHVRDNIYSIIVATEKSTQFLLWLSKLSDSNDSLSLPIQYQEHMMSALSIMENDIALVESGS